MLKRLLLAVLLAISPSPVLAAPAACAPQILEGIAPKLVNEKLAARTRELCFSGFAVLYSGITRTPLWSAEHLTRERIDAAEEIPRQGSFHPERRLPADERSELSDYSRSGFDRGHMAPSGDMADSRSQRDSFSLANIVPQNPNNNRRLWEAIERTVRSLARRDGEVYVVTGPIFAGETLKRLHGRVLVPTGIFKAVYDPERGEAAAYVVRNAPGDEWQKVSIAELAQITGIDVFPDLPEAAKTAAMTLPAPRYHGRRR